MRSLFARLFSTQVIVVLVALLVLGFSLSYMYTQYIFSWKERELIRIGQRLATEFGIGAPVPGLSRIRALLEAAHVYGDASIWVVNADGLVLVASAEERQTEGLYLDKDDVRAILSGNVVRRRSFLKEAPEPSFSVAVPIKTPFGVAGAVILSAPLLGVMQTIHDGRQLIFWSGVLAATLAAAVSFLFARRVAEPLNEMRVVAMDMAKGDFSRRVRISGHRDEVDELSMAFNELATRLDASMHALVAEKSKTDSCIAGLAEGVLAVDTNQEIILVNGAANRLLEPNSAQVGESLYALAKSHGLPTRLRETFAQVLQEQIPQQFLVDSASQTVMVNVNPVKSPDGAVLGAVALLTDVSERQRLEKMRRDFVADVSHELRTPLTSIYGFAQAIADNVVTQKDQIERCLGVIMDESMRLIRLTNTLTDLSHIESQHVKLNLAPVDLSEIASDAIAFLEPRFAEKSINMQVELDPELLPVLADADRLEQVLLNLLDNASRHVPQNGTIVLRARQADSHIEISVEDNGPGIPDEELPFIWERFYKVDKARRQRRAGGTGLGLVIVKQLVELHGGRVEASNRSSGGARFTVSLPVADTHPSNEE